MAGMTSITYETEMDTGGSFQLIGKTTDLSYRVKDLTMQSFYVFRISARNKAGYVATSEVFQYMATLPPDAPDTPNTLVTSASVSSSFYEYPSLSSSPQAEGATVKFSPTAIDGFAWAIIVEEASEKLVNVASIKAGTYAIGGAACSIFAQSVKGKEIYYWRLGSKDDPTDPTSCYMGHGTSYYIFVYVESASSVAAGLNDGTLSGGVPLTIVTGRSNTFYALPQLKSPLTESGVTLAFTTRRPGWGWAMILSEADAKSAAKVDVYNLQDALGGPICKHENKRLFAYREEVWVFSGCLLPISERFTVLVYVSGIGAHLDGTLAGTSSSTIPASNTYSTYPTIAGFPTGDGLTIQFRTKESGRVWIMLTEGPAALTMEAIKSADGAVGGPLCRLMNAQIDTSLQTVTLEGCKLNSGPQYTLHSYTEGDNTIGDDGSFAGSVIFQVTPSNAFETYPVIVSEITGLGLTFQMSSRFAGRYWSIIQSGSAQSAVEVVKDGSSALGTSECSKAGLDLLGSGSIQEVTLTSCGLMQNTEYSLVVYVEDYNGDNDGVLISPLPFQLDKSNDFEDSPVMVPLSSSPQGFLLEFTATRPGFGWAAYFEDFSTAWDYFQNAPSFLDDFYPDSGLPCTPAEFNVSGPENVTVVDFSSCALNFSGTYWATVYIEGEVKTKSGAISYPAKVTIPASNVFYRQPVSHLVRPKFANFTVAASREGEMWAMIVHERDVDTVTIQTVKAGYKANGMDTCRLQAVQVKTSNQTYTLTDCRMIATEVYYAFFYVEGDGGVSEDDGTLSEPVFLWYNSSNAFVREPRIRGTMDTNIFYYSYIPEVEGQLWSVVALSDFDDVITVWNIKDMNYGQKANDCKRERKYIYGAPFEEVEEYLFCYFERGPAVYRLYIYIEDMKDDFDGVMYTIPVIVPGVAEVTNEFTTRPYLVEPATIRGAKFFWRPYRRGHAWAGIISEASWAYRDPINNSNGNHADDDSVSIRDMQAGINLEGSLEDCWVNYTAIVANEGYTWELKNCNLQAGERYRLFVYIVFEEDYDDFQAFLIGADYPFVWLKNREKQRNNGRMSNGVLLEPPFSNDFAWPDGAPYISNGPHGMGMDVTFSTAKPSSLAWMIIQEVKEGEENNITIAAIKEARDSVGAARCRKISEPVNEATTYTFNLDDCRMQPDPKRYVLLVYTEDQSLQNDGRRAEPIYFEVPISNDFRKFPLFVGEQGVDTGLTISFEARNAGKAWIIVVEKEVAAENAVTIVNVKEAEFAFDKANCMADGIEISAVFEVHSLPDCPLAYLRQYEVYVYIEDANENRDGVLSAPMHLQVLSSNTFKAEPVLTALPTTDDVGVRFTTNKRGRAWIVLQPLASLVEAPSRAFMKAVVGAVGGPRCRVQGDVIEPVEQVYQLTDCELDPGQIYALYVYVEDHRDNVDGLLSRLVTVKVRRSNNFLQSPIQIGTPTLDGLTIEFTATEAEGRAWGMAVEALGGSAVTSLSIRQLTGALGGPLCSRQNVPIGNSTELWYFSGCGFQQGVTYMVFIYIEGYPAVEGDGALSGPVIASFFDASNLTFLAGAAQEERCSTDGASTCFMKSPELAATSIIEEVRIGFTAATQGLAWGLILPSANASEATPESVKNGLTITGQKPCALPAVELDNTSMQVITFQGCSLRAGIRFMAFPLVTYKAYVYIEGSGGGVGVLSPGVDVNVIEDKSNWFIAEPRQAGASTPNGVTLQLTTAAASGRLWALFARYRPGVNRESVRSLRNAVGPDDCRIKDREVAAGEVFIQLNNCSLERGEYYYAYVYVSGPSGGLDGTLSQPVEVHVPMTSNTFSAYPRLLSTPLEDEVRITFAAGQEFGKAWIMLTEAHLASFVTIPGVKSLTNAVGGSECRVVEMSIDTQPQVVLLQARVPDLFPERGCGLVENGLYVASVYVEDSNGLGDGMLSQLPVQVRPRPAASNQVASGPVLIDDPTKFNVNLRFVASKPGKFWAFVVKTEVASEITADVARYMELNPNTVGRPGCRVNGRSMDTSEVVVNLVDCDLEITVTAFNIYSAFVYVEDDSGEPGSVSAGLTLFPISNTYLAPFPRIVNVTPEGDVAVRLTLRNSGKVWAKIVFANAYSSFERYYGDLTLYMMKDWDLYDDGPSYYVENCSFTGQDVHVDTDADGNPVPMWLNFSNCTFKSGTNYKIAIYAEDFREADDGEMIGVNLLGMFNATNYFLSSPRVIGTPTSDGLTFQFRPKQPGTAWCAIVRPEEAKDVGGERVVQGDLGIGSSTCCQSGFGTPIGSGIEEWHVTSCGLLPASDYVLFVYVVTGNTLDGTISAGYNFTTFGTIGHIRVTWLQKETDDGGAIDRYRIFLNGSQSFDDYGLRSSLEQTRAGSPPQWKRIVDVACTPGLSYQVTLSGRNAGGWSEVGEPLNTGCFLRPGQATNLRQVSVPSWTAAVGDNSVEEKTAVYIAWTPPVEVSGAETAFYNVYRDDGGMQAAFRLLGTTVEPRFTDAGLEAGRQYGYQVASVNAFGEGPVSSPVLFVTALDLPPPGSKPSLDQTLESSVDLSWPSQAYGPLGLFGGAEIVSTVVYRNGVQIYPQGNDFARQLEAKFTLLDPEQGAGRVTLTFTPIAKGRVWAMAVQESLARYVTSAAVTTGNFSAMGGIECSLSGSEIEAVSQTFEIPCTFPPGNFSFFVAVAGPNEGDNVSAVLSEASTIETLGTQASNKFLALPETFGLVTTNVINVRFTPEVNGSAWVIVRGDYSFKDWTSTMVMNLEDAVGGPACRRDEFPVNELGTVQEYEIILDDCALQSGYTYFVLVYIVGSESSDILSGTLARLDVRTPETSNVFLVGPTMAGTPFRTPTRGVRFNFTALTPGFLWAHIVETTAVVDELAMIDGAISASSEPTCKLVAHPISAQPESLILYGCRDLDEITPYYFYVYMEDAFGNGNGGGVLSRRMDVFIPTASIRNTFEEYPYLGGPPSTDKVIVNFTPRGYSPASPLGRVWIILVVPNLLAQTTQKTVISVGEDLPPYGPDVSNSEPCFVAGDNVDNTPQSFVLSGCRLTPGRDYSVVVLLSDSGVPLASFCTMTSESTHVTFTVPEISNEFTSAPQLTEKSDGDSVSLTFTTKVGGTAWALLSEGISRKHGRDRFYGSVFKNAMADPFAEAMSVVAEAEKQQSQGVEVSVWMMELRLALMVPSQSARVRAVLERHSWLGARFAVPPDLVTLHSDLDVNREYLGAAVVGDSTCRVRKSIEGGVQQFMRLTGCNLQPGASYNAHIYAEGEGGSDGIVSDGVVVSIPPPTATQVERNFFLQEPILTSFDRVSGDFFSVNFAANSSQGLAWSLVFLEEEVIAFNRKVSGEDFFAGSTLGPIGGSGCRHAAVPITSEQKEFSFSDCGFLPGKSYLTFLFVCTEEALAAVAIGSVPEGEMAVGPVLEMPYIASAGFNWTCHGLACPNATGVTLGEVAAADGVAYVFGLDGERSFQVLGYGDNEAAHITIHGPVVVAVVRQALALPKGYGDPCEEASLTISMNLAGSLVLDTFRQDLSVRLCPGGEHHRPGDDNLDYENPHSKLVRIVEAGEQASISWKTGELSSSAAPPAGWSVSIMSVGLFQMEGYSPLMKSASGSTRSFSDTQVVEGTALSYQTRSMSAFGPGAASGPSDGIIIYDPPGAVSKPRLVGRSTNSVSLRWVKPSASGSVITGFVLYQRTSATADGKHVGQWMAAYSGTSVAFSVTAAEPGLFYDFALSATNAAGEGPIGEPLLNIPACATPGMPRNLQARVLALGGEGTTAQHCEVTWLEPFADGGCELERYSLLVDGKPSLNGWPGESNRSTSLLLTLSDGLVLLSKHRLSIQAVNAAGPSIAAEVDLVMAQPPPAVSGLSASAFGRGGVSIRWDAATSYGGLPILGHRIYVDRGFDILPYRTTVSGDVSCDAYGRSAAYREYLESDVRMVVSGGCPNHFSGCQKEYCDGRTTEATPTAAVYQIPAVPTLRDNSFSQSLRCSPGTVGIALNGIPIRSPATSAQTRAYLGGPEHCGDAIEEGAGSFDACGGRADAMGAYHYHSLPYCLLATLNATRYTHSPQVGWSLDGFPIYGPRGPHGIAMTPCTLHGHLNPKPCLDPCGGFAGPLPDVDQFLYRYYMPGPLDDLTCSAHTGNSSCHSVVNGDSPCCARQLPTSELYPYSLGCFRGCTWSEIDAGLCTGPSGVADEERLPEVARSAAEPFSLSPDNDWGKNASTSVQSAHATSRSSLTVSPQELMRIRGAGPSSPYACFRVAALNAATEMGQAAVYSDPLCVSVVDVPPAPGWLRAVRRASGWMSFAWEEAVTDRGHPILAYQIEFRLAEGNEEWQLLESTSPDIRRATLDPCVPGTFYEVRVRGRNDAGAGHYRTETFACATVPSAPISLETPAARFVRRHPDGLECRFALSWTPPDDGGAEITRYKLYRVGVHPIEHNFDPSESEYLVCDVTSNRCSDHVPKRPAGPYRYSVSAVNEVGEGSRSPPLELVCDEIPRAPTAVQETELEGNRLGLNWQPPISGEASTMPLYYQITASNDTGRTRIWRGLTRASKPFRLSELQVSATDPTDFAVQSVNAVTLQHLWLSSELMLTRFPVPWKGSPLLKATSGKPFQVELSWTYEAKLTGIPVGYELQISNFGQADSFVTVYNGSAESAIIDHVPCGNDNYFRVRVFTWDVSSDFSDVLAVRGCPVPTEPQDLEVCREDYGDGALSLSWDPPRIVGGCPVTGYSIYEETAIGSMHLGNTRWNTFIPPAGAGFRTFHICAATLQSECGWNATLSGWWSLPLLASTLRVGGGALAEGEVSLEWDAVSPVALNPDSLFTDPPKVFYYLQGAILGSEDFEDVEGGPTDKTSAIIGGLEPEQEYLFRVGAAQLAGGVLQTRPLGGRLAWSQPLKLRVGGALVFPAVLSEITLPRVPASMGAARLDRRAQPQKKSLSIRWSAPGVTHGLPLQNYEIQTDGGFGGDFVDSYLIPSEYRKFQLNGLSPGARFRVRLRASNVAGYSEWGPEASFLVCGQPGAPGSLQGAWDERVVRPSLQWLAPLDTGGSIMGEVRISKYRIWLQLPGAPSATLFAEVSGGQTYFEVDMPEIFSPQLFFHVTAVNENFESSASNTLELLASAPPGQVGKPMLQKVEGQAMYLSWSMPVSVARGCNPVLPECKSVMSQFPTAEQAIGYELYWDAGSGSWPEELVYLGAQPAAKIRLPLASSGPDVPTQYRFRARAYNSKGEGVFSEAVNIAVAPPEKPSDFKVMSVRDGTVFLMWSAVTDAASVWYEVFFIDQVTNAAESVVALLPSAEIDMLQQETLYEFKVRACNTALCGAFAEVAPQLIPADQPTAPTVPYTIGYEDGVITIGWTSHEGTSWHPSVHSFVIEAAPSFHGPYVNVGEVSVNEPPVMNHSCNETANDTVGDFPATVYFKVFALDGSGMWSRGMETSAVGFLCTELPKAPGPPKLTLGRNGTRAAPGTFSVLVDLELAGQSSETMAIHSGWRLEMFNGESSEDLRTVVSLTDPNLRSYTFSGLPAGSDVKIQYAVRSLVGDGPLSEVSVVRTSLKPPKPRNLAAEWSTDTEIRLRWDWEESQDGDVLEGFYVFAEWRGSDISYLDPDEPTFSDNSTTDTRYTVDCTNAAALGNESRSHQGLWLRVAAVSPAVGVGELSDAFYWVCAQAPDRAAAPTLHDVQEQYTLLNWVEPDLHGAKLLAVRVLGIDSQGPHAAGMVEEEYYFPAPIGPVLNITGANKSQPYRFAVQAISEVGEGPLSPWLIPPPRLSLGPLPPRVTVRSSTNAAIIIEWSLDRNKERGAFTKGYYVYVSIDGTTWPDPDTGYYARWNDEFLTEYEMDCTKASSLGGQSRAKQYLWFKVASWSNSNFERVRGPLSDAVARRCSAPPSAPQNLRMNISHFDAARSTGDTVITWDEPAELNDAVLLGYKVYVDDGNSVDLLAGTVNALDLYTLAEVITDPELREYKSEGVVQGRTYKYKVVAVSEAGEGTAAEAAIVSSTPPVAPSKPELLDDCTTTWYTTKVYCTVYQERFLVLKDIELRLSADIIDARSFNILTQGTIFEPVEELISADGRLYLRIADDLGWAWDDTPLFPGDPFVYRLPMLKFTWSWQDDEIKALGGLPLTGWGLHLSEDGVTWPNESVKTAAASDRHAFLECVGGEDYWVRVAAVNSLGEGPPSESLRMRCNLPPGRQTAPYRVDGDETSIVVEFSPVNLNSAPLTGHRLSYGPDTYGNTFLGSVVTVDLPLKYKRYNASGLMPGWTYAFKVQAITESGMSTDPGWQSKIVSGGLPTAPDPPAYVTSDGSTLQVEWASLDISKFDTGGSEIIGYKLYVSADDRRWPGLDEAVVDGDNASTYAHDCSQTPDYTTLGKNGQPTMVDRRFGYVYMKVAILSESGLGNVSEAATLYCAPPPDAPVVELANAESQQVTLRWTVPDTKGAPLVGYNIYMDDALGGELTLWTHLAASDVAMDETQTYVVISLYPLEPEKDYRVQVTTLTPAAESIKKVFQVQTCQVPATPVIYRIASSSSVFIQWDVPRLDTVFCFVVGYQIIVEEDLADYVPGENESFANFSNVTANWTLYNTSGMIDSSKIGSTISGLVPESLYRFKVRAHIASGYRDGAYTQAVAAGVPAQMPAPSHETAFSSVSAVYLSWSKPAMHGGKAIGYEVFRNDGPGTNMRTEPDSSCIAAAACDNPPCDFVSAAKVPHAAGCSISGLKKDVSYRFRVRAINEYGPGPLSEAAEVPIGTIPSVKPPWLASAAYEGCALTWQWNPAVENGRLAHSYELKIQALTASVTATTTATGDENDTNDTAPSPPGAVTGSGEAQADLIVYPEMVWALNGTTDKPFVAMQVTLNESAWSGLIPGGRYRAAIRARSEIGTSAWSDWSVLDDPDRGAGYCLSVPDTPTGLRRDPSRLVRAGRVFLSWDPVLTADQAGGDDPNNLGVLYEIWGKPTPEFGNTSWRSLLQIATHKADPLGLGPPAAVAAAAMVDTYPETAVTANWIFKMRVKNRNSLYSAFSSEVPLSTGQLASVPRKLTARFAGSGKVELSWQVPEADGYTPIVSYEARCNSGTWEEVQNTRLSHELEDSPSPGLASCEVRAVNNVGPGPSATTSITVL
eukprot:TRINITY_DN28729_c0_g1_i1.p1 TRINITY_DN28729_c0_g1~~TRINITY_DN28729_c0_g1_i1.p1  ORF type:complete len:8011 (-),score=1403.57 TRINITY_DN28729_c0_g1_i1:177-21446(-)